MSRQLPLRGILVILAAVLAGCHPQQPFYFHEDGDLSHYVGMATEIEYPDVESQTLGEVEHAARPFSLENSQPREMWDLGLEEAVKCALRNNKVMRSIGGQVLGPPEFILRNPELAPTVYDPAILESHPRSGVEAALSAFDAQFTTSVFWERNDTPRNVPSDNPLIPVIFEQDLGTFQARLLKTNATGGTWALTHNVRYEWNNTPESFRLFPSDWNVNLEAEFRQPLLQGGGVQFNRIAGPGAIPGFNNGVMLARISTDIALADFEAGVRDLVSDTEEAYWELYFAYRNLDAVIAGRNSALQTWRKIHALYQEGARGGEAEKEAQAREQYFLFRAAVEQALNNLYSTESKLRYLMGLAATDGRLIRPSENPTNAKVAFDWNEALCEALARSAELRQQKWIIKRRELELIAAKNYLLPRLDAVGRYRWLGLGDNLIEPHGGSGNPAEVDSNAYQSMTSGHFQDWHLGLELSVPIGFRKEMAGVRHAQLNLARDRARLQEGELELSHQLAFAIRELEANRVLTQTNFNRRVAALRQVEAVAAAYETETVTLDLLLEAQRRLAQAESDYYRSLVNYNKSIADVHLRKGSLLEYNGVFLAEGPWPDKAYFDAHGRARQRDASTYLDYGFTLPKVISRGPVPQSAGGVLGPDTGIGDLEGGEPAPGPEPIPAPEPESGDPAYQPRPIPAPKPDFQTRPRLIPTPDSQVQPRLIPAPRGTAQAEPKAVEGPQLIGNTTPAVAKTRELAADGLAASAKTVGGSAVRHASHEEPIAESNGGKASAARSTTTTSGVKWGNPQRSSADASDARPAPAVAERSASGWKKVQR